MGTHPRRFCPAGGGTQPCIDVSAHEAAPLAQPVQRTQQRHRLLCQRAAVRGRQGCLRPGLPPRCRICKTEEREALVGPACSAGAWGHRHMWGRGLGWPTSEERRVRGAGGEQSSQEAKQLLHEALHIPCPVHLVPRWQHSPQQVQRQDLVGAR